MSQINDAIGDILRNRRKSAKQRLLGRSKKRANLNTRRSRTKNKSFRKTKFLFKMLDKTIALAEIPFWASLSLANKATGKVVDNRALRKTALVAGTTAVKQSTGIGQIETAGKATRLGMKALDVALPLLTSTSSLLHTFSKAVKRKVNQNKYNKRADMSNVPRPSTSTNEHTYGKQPAYQAPNVSELNSDLDEAKKREYINADATSVSDTDYTDVENDYSDEEEYIDEMPVKEPSREIPKEIPSTESPKLSQPNESKRPKLLTNGSLNVDEAFNNEVYTKLLFKKGKLADELPTEEIISKTNPLDVLNLNLAKDKVIDFEFLEANFKESDLNAMREYNKDTDSKLDNLSQLLYS